MPQLDTPMRERHLRLALATATAAALTGGLLSVAATPAAAATEEAEPAGGAEAVQPDGAEAEAVAEAQPAVAQAAARVIKPARLQDTAEATVVRME